MGEELRRVTAIDPDSLSA